jgi:hypothetical protein
MANLTPFQLLLWIAGLMMIIAPIIGVAIGIAMKSVYKAKEQYIVHLVTVFSKAGSATIENIAKEMEGKMKNGNNVQAGKNNGGGSNP